VGQASSKFRAGSGGILFRFALQSHVQTSWRLRSLEAAWRAQPWRPLVFSRGGILQEKQGSRVQTSPYAA